MTGLRPDLVVGHAKHTGMRFFESLSLFELKFIVFGCRLFLYTFYVFVYVSVNIDWGL
jgi:hypothetical protein